MLSLAVTSLFDGSSPGLYALSLLVLIVGIAVEIRRVRREAPDRPVTEAEDPRVLPGEDA